MSAGIKIAQVGDIPVGTVKVFEVNFEADNSDEATPVAVCNVDGKYYAIRDVCTHDDAPLDQGELDGCQIECPRHGAKFDVTTGKALCLPAVLPVPTYPIKVEGNDIFVLLK